jgi:hypothetical protein
MGSYVQVLRVLGLERDLALIAKDDPLGRALQDEALPARRRAPKRPVPPPAHAGTSGGPRRGDGPQAR